MLVALNARAHFADGSRPAGDGAVRFGAARVHKLRRARPIAAHTPRYAADLEWRRRRRNARRARRRASPHAAAGRSANAANEVHSTRPHGAFIQIFTSIQSEDAAAAHFPTCGICRATQ